MSQSGLLIYGITQNAPPVESQKGIIPFQRCSAENQMGASAVQRPWG